MYKNINALVVILCLLYLKPSIIIIKKIFDFVGKLKLKFYYKF